MGKLSTKLSGSTLIEVLVAMVIILVVSLIVATFFTQNYRKLNTEYKLKAILVLNNEVERVIQVGYCEPNIVFSRVVNGFKLETEVTENAYSNELVNLSVTVRENDGQFIVQRRIVCIRKLVGRL